MFWENEKDIGKTTVDSWGLKMAPWRHSRVGKGISAQASHRTVRESLPSYGSCYPIMPLFQVSSGKTNRDLQLDIDHT
jgi:hypothetical protein